VGGSLSRVSEAFGHIAQPRADGEQASNVGVNRSLRLASGGVLAGAPGRTRTCDRLL